VPRTSRWDYLVNEAHVDVGGFPKRSLGGLESNNFSLAEVLEHIDFSRKVGQSSENLLKRSYELGHCTWSQVCPSPAERRLFAIFNFKKNAYSFP
jgi:hypothetical protein